MKEAGIMEVISAAMGQSFFTLSLGMGAMAIFRKLYRQEENPSGRGDLYSDSGHLRCFYMRD